MGIIQKIFFKKILENTNSRTIYYVNIKDREVVSNFFISKLLLYETI